MSATNGTGPGLAPNHLEMLKASAITVEVIAERSYRTVTKRSELADLGYASSQRPVPSLLFPQHGVKGGIVGYQIRPDTPMVIGGKIWKYVSPKGSEIRLSAPPRCRRFLRSSITPLFITEGDKKADALASAGLCALSVQGVDCWNVPQDWAGIALDGRDVYITYDSDVSVKRSVHGALRRLWQFLVANGANVHIVYLPDDQDGGKTGVDDYLFAGHTVEDLYRLAELELRDPPPEPGPERRPAWNTGVLLFNVEKQLGRFVHLDSAGHERAALALYVMHSWSFKAAAATPYLYVKSPQKRSGKTRLLELLAELCRHPLRASSVTEAAIFQAVEKWKPTLLVDEVDAIFYGRSERAEALRLVLDAGNRPGSPVVRGTQDGEPRLFETYCPKVLAGIDRGLPDTIRDRAIVIAMERKLGGDRVERFRRRDLAAELADLCGRFDDWAAEHTETLTEYRFGERLNVSDRLEEAWEPLIAIADLAGGEWPQRARKAAEALAKADAGNEGVDDSQTLLVALKDVFAEHEALHSKTICQALNTDDELPFHDYRNGKGIDGRGLSRLLKAYGIHMEQFRLDKVRARGYRREQFTEAWERYVRDGDAAGDAGRAGHRDTDVANDGAKRKTGVPVPGDGSGTEPGQPETAAPSQDGRPCPGVPLVTDEVQPPPHAHASSNGRVLDEDQLVEQFIVEFDATELDADEADTLDRCPPRPLSEAESVKPRRFGDTETSIPTRCAVLVEQLGPALNRLDNNGHPVTLCAVAGEVSPMGPSDRDLRRALEAHGYAAPAAPENPPEAPCPYAEHRASDWRLHPRGNAPPPWVCGVCHPPTLGLDIERRIAEPAP